MKTVRQSLALAFASLLFAGCALALSGCATGSGGNNSADTDVLKNKTFGQ